MNIKSLVNNLPSTNGIYIFLKNSAPIYIGKSVNIKARVKSHFENAKLDRKEAIIINNTNDIKYIVTESEFKAIILEAQLIQKHLPKYNIICRDNKSLLYIKITIKDEYPKILLVRRENDKKSTYFGPFSNKKVAEEIVNEIRRVFPFCIQKNITQKMCFYSKINLCNPCPNYISHLTDNKEKSKLTKIYKYNIRGVINTLSGKTNTVLKTLYNKMTRLAVEKRYEEGIILRNKINRFEHFISNQMSHDSNIYEVNRSNESLIELTNIISKYYPNVKSINRIECYDVSNLAFSHPTASMVVFTKGLADKAEYRRFKIRNKKLKSDLAMLEHIFLRRIHNRWQSPDLIVVDGGKVQVTIMKRVINNDKVNIPIIGIAKNPDRVIVGARDLQYLNLPNNNLAFILLRHIRDESHRFAKKYHLILRKKAMMV